MILLTILLPVFSVNNLNIPTELKNFFDQLNIINEETLSSDDNDSSFSINCKYYDTNNFRVHNLINLQSSNFSAFHLNIALRG